MHNRKNSLFILLLVAAGCGDDPVSYSAPVGIELKAESDKVVNGTLTESKGITTESGNPYGAFVSEARNRLGRDPGLVDLASATMLVGADSTGVVALNEIFDGRVEVLFEMNDTNDTFPVASAVIDATVEGAGPLELDRMFDYTTLAGTNETKFLGGSFNVVYRGPVHADFAGKSAKADLQITFTFEAFE